MSSVFTSILTRGPVSRRDVARLTQLSQGAVTKLIRPMLEHGYVVEQDGESDGPGRPMIPLTIAPDRHFAVGVKVMRTEVTGVLVDLHAEVRGSARRHVSQPTPGAVVAATTELVDELIDSTPGARELTVGLGVGLAGHVDSNAGMLRLSTLLDWHDVPLASLLNHSTKLPVVIENDVNTLAVAEHWFGAGRAADSFAVVTVGAGIGCGLIVSGQLWHGVSGIAGELGHIVVAPEGPVCHCGKRGCLESLASDDAIVAAVRASGTEVLTVALAAKLAHEGHEAARAAFRTAGTALGRGVAVLLNLLNPSLLILSGEGVHASDLFMDALRQELAREAFSAAAADCQLVVRPLPDETWARGAAATALRRGVLKSLAELSALVPA